MSVLDRVQKFSLAFVFKRQSTVKKKKNKQNGPEVLFSLFFFLTFLYCNMGAWIMKPHIVKARWFY